MREWPYTTWSGDVYNTHCGSRFPLALAKSVVRRGCSLFNPTHSSSRQCMFVLMYEHCMYIVHTVISPHSLLPQEYCHGHGFNATWENRIFEIKLNRLFPVAAFLLALCSRRSICIDSRSCVKVC